MNATEHGRRPFPGGARDLPTRSATGRWRRGRSTWSARPRSGSASSTRRAATSGRRCASSTPSATSRGSPSPSTTSRRSPSRLATCPAPLGCGERPGPCHRRAASGSPTSSTSSSSTTAARTPGRPRRDGARASTPREGRAMTLDESVAYALETTIDELAPHDHAGDPMTMRADPPDRRGAADGRDVGGDRRGPGLRRPDLRQLRRGDGRAEVQADLPLRLLPVLLGLLLSAIRLH